MKYLILVFTLFVTTIQAEQFQASFTNTEWKVTESPLECRLSQQIPGFGRAEFSQYPGQDFSLIFSTSSHPAKPANVSFEIAEAPWQNIEERLHLISMPTEKNQGKFVLSGHLAKQAFTDTEEGKFPAVRYSSYLSHEEISAFLSTVHFRDTSIAFSKCIENLFPYTYEQMRHLTVYFNLEESTISEEGVTALTTLADYVKIDDRIKQITISGHTDNHGRKRLNIPLSEARAMSIKTFLVDKQGIAEELITTSYHREFIAAASNKTQKGRSHNRRAEIELIR